MSAITHRRPNPILDRIFFSSMALFILAAVLYGFAKTYFLAGMVMAPLPNIIIQIHGAVFTLWLLLYLIQTALISARNIKLHRTLGLFTFGLAVFMVLIAIAAAVDQLRRNHAPYGMDPKTFFIIPISAILLFALYVYFAYAQRSNPIAHKRLVLMANLAIIDAAIGRWPITALELHPIYQDYILFALILLIILFDLIQLHRITRTMLWAAPVYIIVHLVRVPIGMSAPWHTFANLFLPH